MDENFEMLGVYILIFGFYFYKVVLFGAIRATSAPVTTSKYIQNSHQFKF